jgi:hypothetical protein
MVSHTECSGEPPGHRPPKERQRRCRRSSAGAGSRRRADRRGARHLRLVAGVAYLVVVGEGGACRCPFGVRCQRRSAACRPRRRRRQAITRRTSSPIRVSICSPGWQVAGVRFSLRVWRSKATCGSIQADAPGPSGGPSAEGVRALHRNCPRVIPARAVRQPRASERRTASAPTFGRA